MIGPFVKGRGVTPQVHERLVLVKDSSSTLRVVLHLRDVYVLVRCNPLKRCISRNGVFTPLLSCGSKLIQRIEEKGGVEGELNVDLMYSMKCIVYSL